MRFFTILLLVALVIGGIYHQWPSIAPAFSPALASKSTLDMTGTWSYADGPIRSTYVLRADGTCTYSLTLPRHIPQQPDKHGKWHVEDDTLCIVYPTAKSPTSHILPDPADDRRHPISIQGSTISFSGDAPNSTFTRR